MADELTMNGETLPPPRFRTLAIMAVIVALAVILILAAALTLGSQGPLWAQDSLDCSATDLGTLKAEAESELETNGRWTTQDCDSLFLTDSDAHFYRFQLAEDGKVRIDLTSAEGDSYLHLLNVDGSRIIHDDDTGRDLNARIEFQLAAGTYLIEAASAAGRIRGPADFILSIRVATDCEPIDLGALEPGLGLLAEGVWNINDCGARFRRDTPAHTFRFHLPQEGSVLIDLTAPEGGDPYVYLLSSDGAYLYSDDDGGAGRNSRIENDLAPGTYLIEATTYGDRDHAHELTDFTLTIRLVDEDTFRLKAEAIQIPDQIVAGEPFTVQYRVGNAGRTNLPEGYSAEVLLAGRGLYELADLISSSDGHWQAGDSYHSGDEIASFASAASGALSPFEVSLRRPGDTWLVLGVITYDENEEEVAFHGISREFVVLSGFAFGSVPARVGLVPYEVSAEADEEGTVTNTVISVSSPAAEVDPDIQAKAIYAAGVRTQILDGLFDRPALSDLTVGFARQMLTLENPSSSTLLDVVTNRYTSDIAATGLSEGLASAEADLRATIENRLLDAADTASAHYSSIAASWTAHQVWAGTGRALSFTEALNIQSQLAYAERIASPTIAAGEIVQAARAAELGWEDPDVQAMVDDFALQGSCRSAETSLRTGLEAAGVEDVDALIDIDAEMREALPLFGLANDSVLCALEGLDSDNSRFLGNLSIAGNEAIQEIFTPDTPEPQVVLSPHKLRIIAMLGDDGRIELGVEVSGGDQVLPDLRHLPAGSPVGVWLISSDVEVDGSSIGKIRARQLDDGRVELGFLSPDGETITPNIRFLASDISAGVWLRSSEIEVQQVGQLE